MKKKTEKKTEIPQQKLDPTTAKRVLDVDLGNLLKKVQAGKPLTRYERELITREAERGPVKTTGPVLTFVGTKAALAQALACTRQLVHLYSKKPTSPKPRDDGRYDVSAWRTFLRDHCRLPQFADDSEAVTQTQARAEQLLIQNDRLRLKLKREKEQLIPKLVAQQVFGKLLVAAKSRCYTSIIRFVTLARMAESTAAAMEAVKTEMDGIWQSLTDPSKWMKN